VLGEFAYSRKDPGNAAVSVRPSVFSDLSAPLLPAGFPCNVTLGASMIICQENSDFIKIGQKIGKFIFRPK
jgi:hypothetical protein